MSSLTWPIPMSCPQPGTSDDRGAHFTENRDDLRRAFDEVGLAARLRAPEHGTWVPLHA